MTWKEAFFASPGPASVKKAGLLSLKGLCMGSADVIPGVSGGTIALITGIYEDLIGALKSIDATMVKKALAFDLKGALAGVHIRFLLCLFVGIAIAIISLARLMNFLLNHYPVFTWSLFFGLIAASILVVSRKVTTWSPRTGISLVVGTVVAAFIVNLMPVTTPEALWFILLCGMIAICAMILPGISGAFILLILGKYEFNTATLKNPFLPQNLMIIIIFCLGCLIGLLGFCTDQVLAWLRVYLFPWTGEGGGGKSHAAIRGFIAKTGRFIRPKPRRTQTPPVGESAPALSKNATGLLAEMREKE